MLNNRYLIVSVCFLILYVLTIVIGNAITFLDLALIIYIFEDKKINENTLIGYVLTIGLLNDIFYGFLFGTTVLILLSIAATRYIFIKNFSYYEIPQVKLIYGIIASIQYNLLFLLFMNKHNSSSSPMVFEHIIIDIIVVTIIQLITDRKIAVQNT
jgi:cell shape-determining protein MreD